MRRFPGEILQEIFCFYAKQDIWNNAFGADRNAGPFKLGHISHKWRSIAHSYSALWHHTLRLEVDNGAKLRDPLALLNFILTKFCPSKDISFYLVGSQQHAAVTSRLLEALIAVCPRWKSAVFRRLPLDVIPLLSSVSPPAQRLRDLTIIVNPNTPVDVHLDFSQCFSVERLELEGIPFRNISLPYGALRCCADGTSYDASESPSKALEIIQSCPNLRSFTTTPGHWEARETWNPPPTSYALGFNLPYNFGRRIAGHPQFACAVQPHYPSPLDVLPHIEQLIQASACDITQLSLEDCDICDGEVAMEELLLSTPNLQHLSLEFSVETSDGSCMTRLVREMSRRHSVLVPKLESLTYYDGSNPDDLGFLRAGFMDMLESRYSARGHGLKKVGIVFDAPHPEDVVTLDGNSTAR